MQLVSRFDLHLSVVGHGWLDVMIAIDDVEITYSASNVLNDPLHDLADAALAIEGTAVVRESVALWLEPYWMHLQFEAHDGSDAVHVIVYDEAAHVAVLTGAVSRATARDEIARALLDLQRGATNDDKLEGWGTFPSQKLSALLGHRNRDEVAAALPPPWTLFPDVARIREELICEVGRRHPLFRRKFKLIAVNEATDEYLIELLSGPEPYAVVSLTWSGAQERDPLHPHTEFFASMSAWRMARRRTTPDS